jgi:pilus assembly protein Flp/PilA
MAVEIFSCGDPMFRLWSDQRGAALLEYTLIIGLITLAVIAVVIAVGGWTGGTWSNFLSSVEP